MMHKGVPVRIKELLIHLSCLLLLTVGVVRPSDASAMLNGAPVAVNDETYAPEDTEQTGDVSLNDSDPDGDLLTYTVLVEPEHGTLTLNPNGTFSYMPDLEYVGFDYATYQVCDPSGLCDEAQIEFAMTFVNDLPVAEPDQFYCFIGSSVTGNVTLNDYDLDDEPIFYSILGPPLHAASFNLNINGTFTYTPNPGFEGNDTFIYAMCDPCGACDYTTVTITVVPPNEAPVAEDDLAYGTEDFVFIGDVSTNDTDDDPSTLTYTIISQPAHGFVEMNSDGSYTLTPELDYFGLDEFMYEVCDIYGQCDIGTVAVILSFVNDAPTALDDFATILEDEVLYGDVTLNDSDPDLEPIEWLMWIPPAQGTVAMNSNGTFTYTPPANFFGQVQFTYFMLDPCGYTDTAIMYITVEPVNDAPTANNETLTVSEDTVLNGSVAANDSDVEGEALTWNLIQGPANGIINWQNNGSFTYTPNANYFGTETIFYSVSDPSGGVSNAILTIQVQAVNDPPVAQDEVLSTNEDSPLSGNVSLNDSDIDSGIIFYTFNAAGVPGTFTGFPNGTFNYTPPANYFGTFTVSYQACDGVFCDTAVLQIDVISVNDAPVVAGESLSTNEDVELNGSVSGNDSDIENDVLTYAVITGPSNGSLELLSDGNFIYTPSANWFGTELIEYQACDPSGDCDEGVLEITVISVNDAPVVIGESVSVSEDGSTSGDLALNDLDEDGDVLTYQVTSGALYGSFNLSSGGTWMYSPNANYFGSETIAYEACDGVICMGAELIIQVTPVNDAPVAVNDSRTVLMNGSDNGNLGTNDSDVDDTILFYTALGTASNGTFVLNSDGSYTYSPDYNFFGQEVIQYQVCDDENACSTAQITFNVVNNNSAPMAFNGQMELNEDETLTANVWALVNDPDNNIESYNLISGVNSGALNFNSNGSFSYTPELNFFGQVSFTFEVCDELNACDNAVITLTILPVNDAPIAQNDLAEVAEDASTSGDVSTNDTDVDSGALVFNLVQDAQNGTFALNSNGSWSYTPDANFNGSETITYEVCDQELCEEAQLTINVISVNDLPVGTDTQIETNEDTVLNADVLAQVSDVDDTSFDFELVSNVSSGVLSFEQNGTYIYTPEADYFGEQTFSFEACDDEGACTVATVTILVLPVNDAPVVLDDEITTNEDEVATGNVTTNDYDVDDLAMSCLILVQPAHGTIQLDEEGNFTYTPDADFFGTDEVHYRLCDASEACADGVLYITIEAVNDAPIAQDDIYSAEENAPITGNVSLNDSDIENDVLSFELLDEPMNGSIEFLGDGTFTYTPELDWFGTEVLVYEVCDGLDCATAELFLSIGEVNDPPVAITAQLENCELFSVTVDLSEYISDLQESAEALNLNNIVISSGSYELDGFLLTVTPEVGSEENSISVQYQVCDNGIPSLCSTGLVEINLISPFVPEVVLTEITTPTCEGTEDGSILVTVEDPGFPVEYEWSNGETGLEISGLSAGDYTLTMTPGTECATVEWITMTVQDPAPIVITGLTAEPVNETPGGSSSFEVTGGTGEYTFEWTDGNGDVISNDQVLEGIAVEGNFTLTVFDENGCNTSETILITGLNELTTVSINVWPNPASDQIFISTSALSESINADLYDASGRLVLSENLRDGANGNALLSVTGFESGVYLLVLTSDQFRVEHRVMITQ